MGQNIPLACRNAGVVRSNCLPLRTRQLIPCGSRLVMIQSLFTTPQLLYMSEIPVGPVLHCIGFMGTRKDTKMTTKINTYLNVDNSTERRNADITYLWPVTVQYLRIDGKLPQSRCTLTSGIVYHCPDRVLDLWSIKVHGFR